MTLRDLDHSGALAEEPETQESWALSLPGDEPDSELLPDEGPGERASQLNAFLSGWGHISMSNEVSHVFDRLTVTKWFAGIAKSPSVSV